MKLYNDIYRRASREPAVTCDGLVIDGNRRLAIINELHREKHEERFETPMYDCSNYSEINQAEII